MSDQPETTQCFACQGIMRRMTKLERVQYEDLISDEFKPPLHRYIQCSAEMVTGRDMMVTEKQMGILKARFQGVALTSTQSNRQNAL